MRIYTEVNFEWNDKQGKLVEVSSDSFDYSGEMALLGKGDWHTKVFYDTAGNEWKLRGQESFGKRIGYIQYYKNDKLQKEDESPPGTNKWSYQIYYFRNYAAGHAKADFGDESLFNTDQEAKNYHKTTYFEDRSDSLGVAEEAIARYTGGEYAYAGGDWRHIETELEAEGSKWTEALDEAGEGTGVWSYEMDPDQVDEIQRLIHEEEYDEQYDLNDDGVIDLLDIKALGQGPAAGLKLSTEAAKAGAEIAIRDYIANWEEAIDPGGWDVVETTAKDYIQLLTEKETEVKTAYEDIFGADGTIFDVETKWETAEERARKQFITKSGEFITAKEEGLEETVTGREAELEALREEAGENIRAAEAKIGAAGFATSGVGQTARDVLAKEIGGAARDIDEGFTEERSDVKRQYLEKITPLREELGGEGTAYEDYITNRDLAAKNLLKDWKTKSEEYETAKTYYEEETMPSLISPTSDYMRELESIGGLISEAIMGVTTEIGGADALDPTWDPFKADYLKGLGYTPASFGIDPTTMMFTGLSEDISTAFYEPYKADPSLQLYDPDIKLPWENGGGGGGGGDPYKPGGQR